MALAKSNELKTDKEKIDELLNLARLKYQEGQVDVAVDFFKDVLKLDENNFEANKNLGMVYFNAEEYIKAKEYAETAYEINLNDASVLNLMGDVSIGLGLDKEAKNYLEKSLKINESNANAWSQIGVIEFKANNFSLAKNNFKKAIRLNNENPIFWGNLIRCYQELNKTQKALECINQYLILSGEKEKKLASKVALDLNNAYILSLDGSKRNFSATFITACSLNINITENVLLNFLEIFKNHDNKIGAKIAAEILLYRNHDNANYFKQYVESLIDTDDLDYQMQAANICLNMITSNGVHKDIARKMFIEVLSPINKKSSPAMNLAEIYHQQLKHFDECKANNQEYRNMFDTSGGKKVRGSRNLVEGMIRAGKFKNIQQNL